MTQDQEIPDYSVVLGSPGKVVRHPDEYLGLPAGFLQVGAPGVVSTLWAVAEFSTMLLVRHFYSSHLQGGLPPAEALRHARRRLRDLTARELAEDFAAMRRHAGRYPEQVSTAWRRFAAMEPEAQPFAHPYFWAAFTFTGA